MKILIKRTLYFSIGAFIASSIVSSCEGPKPKSYQYKITGYRDILIRRYSAFDEVNLTEERRRVIAYTDTIHGQNADSIWYWNSDGSKMTILKPFQVEEGNWTFNR